jgi:hypothetical protein
MIHEFVSKQDKRPHLENYRANHQHWPKAVESFSAYSSARPRALGALQRAYSVRSSLSNAPGGAGRGLPTILRGTLP